MDVEKVKEKVRQRREEIEMEDIEEEEMSEVETPKIKTKRKMKMTRFGQVEEMDVDE